MQDTLAPSSTSLAAPSVPVLVTGSNGFIGNRLVKVLLENGHSNVRCLVRPSSNVSSLKAVIAAAGGPAPEIVEGNLLSREDCARVVDGIAIIYHLAAGRGEKSYPDAFMNSVITTRNLLDAAVATGTLTRFVNVSSFTVYSNRKIAAGGMLDESCEIQPEPHLTGEAYCYAKVKQEELVASYGKTAGLPFVNVRPGTVYGPGNRGIPGRVGIGTFGLFLHLGGRNRIPLSYVDNCADAIYLAGVTPGIDGESFNIVDDDLPTSKEFLRMYKKNVRHFRSLTLPRPVSHALSWAWERYSTWSEGQLPPSFNRRKWSGYWKGNTYSNAKVKTRLGWKQRVPLAEALPRYFEFQKRSEPS